MIENGKREWRDGWMAASLYSPRRTEEKGKERGKGKEKGKAQ